MHTWLPAEKACTKIISLICLLCFFFQVAVDSAAPVEGGSRGGGYMEPPGPYGAYGAMLSYGQFPGSLGYDVSRHQYQSYIRFSVFVVYVKRDRRLSIVNYDIVTNLSYVSVWWLWS